jgi:hypothetical protein
MTGFVPSDCYRPSTIALGVVPGLIGTQARDREMG